MLKKISIALSSIAAAAVIFLMSAYAVGLNSPSLQEEALVFSSTEQALAAQDPLPEIKRKEAASAPETIEGSVRTGDAVYEAAVIPGSSAYDLMEAARKGGLSFESEYFSGLGFFISSIGGEKNDLREGRYWTLYINGQRSNLGASNYILKSGDSIEWKLEKN